MRTRTLETSLPPKTASREKWTWATRCSPYDFDYCTSNSVVTSDVYPFNMSQTMNDVVTPDFHKRIKRGEIINNPCDSTVVIRRDAVAQYDQHIESYYETDCPNDEPQKFGWRTYGSVSAEAQCSVGGEVVRPPAPTIAHAPLKDLAVSQAHASVTQKEAMILATAGEAGETIRSAISMFIRLKKILRAVKRFDAQYLRKQITMKELSDRYMEARYAIRPLVYDVQQISNAYNSQKRDKHRQTFRGKEVRTETLVMDDINIVNASQTTKKTIAGSATRTVEVRAGVLTNLEYSKLAVWGFDQILESAWELVPFSFVVDWFLNVGDVLASWTPNVGVEKLASWVSVKDTLTQTTWIGGTEAMPTTEYPMDIAGTFSITGAVCSLTTISKYREPNPYRAVWPRVDVNLDPLKILDLGIILKNLKKFR